MTSHGRRIIGTINSRLRYITANIIQVKNMEHINIKHKICKLNIYINRNFTILTSLNKAMVTA